MQTTKHNLAQKKLLCRGAVRSSLATTSTSS